MPKLTNDQIAELNRLAGEKIANGQRKGQAYLNALSNMRYHSGDPKLYQIYDLILGTDADPYYKDENLDRFFEKIC